MGTGSLHYIPYNRGFQSVDGCTKSWTATYPETVIAIFDFQYIRPFFGTVDGPDEYAWADQCIRMQMKLELDGVLLEATGPFSRSQDGLVRGVGFAGTDLRSYVMTVQHVAPGPHTMTVKAALGPATWGDGEFSHPIYAWYNDTQNLYPGPAFGNRKLIIIRHPYGLPLGA